MKIPVPQEIFSGSPRPIMNTIGKIYKVVITANFNMTDALLYPLNRIQPSELLSQYSEWIYFTLVLVFFISIAGITLRKHFDSPYVKPMIISVGIMLTVGVFMFKERLVMIFEGWGVLGLVLLVVLVSIIPYGLCKGYGMPPLKSFYLTYALLYVLSWIAFPSLFYGLAAKNMGLVNLGLLVMFLYAIFKLIPIKISKPQDSDRFQKESPFSSAIEQNIKTEFRDEKILKHDVSKILNVEIKNIDDMAESLAQMQRYIETHRDRLTANDRSQITSFLQSLTQKENIFKQGLFYLRRFIENMGNMDMKQIDDLKKRLKKANKKEQQILRVEIEREEKKLQIIASAKELETSLLNIINYYNNQIKGAVNNVTNPETYYTVIDYIAKARKSLAEIIDIVKKINDLKNKLIQITKIEKNLMNKELKAA